MILCSLIGQHSLAQSFEYDKRSPQQVYAVQKLSAQLRKHATAKQFRFSFITDSLAHGKEDFAISRTGNHIRISGGSNRALIYASLSIAEEVRNGSSINTIKPREEKAFVPLRAIKYDLPWDSYRHSYALQLHDTTCRDTLYWKAFLDMMVENRFNSLT